MDGYYVSKIDPVITIKTTIENIFCFSFRHCVTTDIHICNLYK